MHQFDSGHISTNQLLNLQEHLKPISIRKTILPTVRGTPIKLPEERTFTRRMPIITQFNVLIDKALTQCFTVYNSPQSKPKHIRSHALLSTSHSKKRLKSMAISNSLTIKRCLYKTLPVRAFISNRKCQSSNITVTNLKQQELISPILIKTLYSPHSCTCNLPSPVNKPSTAVSPHQQRRSYSVRRPPAETLCLDNLLRVERILAPREQEGKVDTKKIIE